MVLDYFFFKAAIARLEALENDYTGMETVEAVDDDEASLDDDDDGIRVSHSFHSCVFFCLENNLLHFPFICFALYGFKLKRMFFDTLKAWKCFVFV
jgi:hypothetical protein